MNQNYVQICQLVPQYFPTLRPITSFNPNDDAQKIHDEFSKSFPKFLSAIAICANRNWIQREQIKSQFALKFNYNLLQHVESKTRDSFKRCFLCLLYIGPDLDAYLMRNYKMGFDKDMDSLIDILTTRTSSQISQIKAIYKQLFKEDLEKKLKFDTSFSFKDILIALCSASRDQSIYIDQGMASADSQVILKELEKMSPSASSLIPIFCNRNYTQLRLTFQICESTSGKSIPDLLSKSAKDEFGKCLKSIYNLATNPIRNSTEQLRFGITTNNILPVIRIICTHFETDLQSVRDDYQALYSTSLVKDIQDKFDFMHKDTTKALLMLMGAY